MPRPSELSPQIEVINTARARFDAVGKDKLSQKFCYENRKVCRIYFVEGLLKIIKSIVSMRKTRLYQPLSVNWLGTYNTCTFADLSYFIHDTYY